MDRYIEGHDLCVYMYTYTQYIHRQRKRERESVSVNEMQNGIRSTPGSGCHFSPPPPLSPSLAPTPSLTDYWAGYPQRGRAKCASCCFGSCIINLLPLHVRMNTRGTCAWQTVTNSMDWITVTLMLSVAWAYLICRGSPWLLIFSMDMEHVRLAKRDWHSLP